MYTVENIQEGIWFKIEQMNKSQKSKERLYNRLIRYPKEIEQNVLEWVNDQPITDINCHGESIKKIMNMYDLNESALPYLIDNFVTYADGHFRIYSDCRGAFGRAKEMEN